MRACACQTCSYCVLYDTVPLAREWFDAQGNPAAVARVLAKIQGRAEPVVPSLPLGDWLGAAAHWLGLAWLAARLTREPAGCSACTRRQARLNAASLRAERWLRGLWRRN